MASRDPYRPNVLLILSDDQGPWAMGCAGNDEIRTPHLDALADRGVRFSRFFCTSPVCSPARASLFTGELPSQHGVHDWLSYHHAGRTGIDFLSGRTLFTDVFADAGYRLGLSGKWHLGANDRPRKGFVHWYAHESGGGPYYGAPLYRDGVRTEEPSYLTDALADDAREFLTAESDRPEPFHLSLHFTAPHKPWKGQHPSEYTELYEDCAFDSCPQGPAHPWQPVDENGAPVGGESDTREALIGYFAATTAMDAAIGRVLDRLDALGLTESTLVIFTSDNGFNAGHHGIWGKGNGTFPQNMYDSSVLVPCLMSQPGRIPAGRHSEALLSQYDVLPTLVEHLGIDHHHDPALPGRSFADILAGTEDGSADPAGGETAAGADRERVVVYDEYGPVRMIRTRDRKYVHRYPHGPHEFYDLVADPGEERNLAGDPSRAEERIALAARLDAWFARYVDPAQDGARLPVTGSGQRTPVTPGSLPTAFEPAPDGAARGSTS
ncbi:sulfatase-like hydrolase/transferase [Streptomyces sp. NBC_00102]|uniref:sulfatase-like hydrolase/transferase n=1 Tax=Streptomyces sp. NBC_00102 TaxID=2975652 RepID=UPI002256BE04|nr:sulfatase-like hydrolase/transferase [Streptomyces sp. NBC_00102]MCX5399254.1 sulfatase-like hydrolase/transferase [Streptomyces sp. NBC_00102]